MKITITECYAIANICTHVYKDRDAFYDKLSSLINRVPKHDMLIAMGNLTQRSALTTKGSRKISCQYEIENLDQNGERLTELCELSSMCIANMIFPHKEIHKFTWNSSDDRT